MTTQTITPEGNKNHLDNGRIHFQSNYPQNQESSKSNKSGLNGVQKPNNQKNPNNFLRSISILFRNIGILVVVVLLVVASLFAYLLTNPDGRVSKWFVDNTIIGTVLNLKETEEQTGSNENSGETESENETSQNKVGNQIFGLETGNGQVGPQPTADLVNNVIDSVISIRTRNTGTRSGFQSSAAGSGFIINENGLVMTNRHVIADACNSDNIEITAQNHNLTVFNLRLLTVDPIDDIALLQIENPPSDLKPVEFADSEQLKLGEEVVAIGNVLGELQNSVTKGIVSGLNRSLQTQLVDPCTGNTIVSDGLIQTDAAINRGNSGGPLFNSQGRLIGMNTFGTTDAQSIGFAIPSSTLISALESYNDNDKIIRPRLGVSSRPITPIDAEENSWLPVKYGEIIIGAQGTNPVVSGSAADRAGLRQFDIITEINGERLEYSQNNLNPLRKALLRNKADEEITLTVYKAREGGDNPQYNENPERITVRLGGVTFEDVKR